MESIMARLRRLANSKRTLHGEHSVIVSVGRMNEIEEAMLEAADLIHQLKAAMVENAR